MASSSSSLRLDLVPDEVLLCLFSFLGSRELIQSVSRVCRRFSSILFSEWYWRRRVADNYGPRSGHKPFPAVGHYSRLEEMQRGSVHGDFLREACSVKSDYMNLQNLSASTGGLDCVHIIHPDLSGTQTMVAAGSRDHKIYLWRKRAPTGNSARTMREYITADLQGHRGWVWCMASNCDSPNVLCSGSWDNEVRLWDVRLQECMFTVRGRHKAAVLGVAFPEPTLVITSCYDKHVRSFDPRDQSHSSVTVVGQHTKAVLCVATSGEHMVYSGSEDKSVKLWDRRRPNEEITAHKFDSGSVTGLCYNEGLLSAAVGKTVHFFNSQLAPISNFVTDHSKALTSVYHNMGMLATGSKDGMAYLHTMSIPHTCLKKFDHFQDVTDVAFSREIFAVSSSDRSVSLWTPRNL